MEQTGEIFGIRKGGKREMKKRILSLVLGLAMVATAAINPMVSYASDDAVTINTYRSEDGNHTVPTDIAPSADVVFAGWYEDADFENPIPETKTTGTAYAKWVPKSVLSVKYQMTSGTTVDSWKTDFRFVTTVDTVYYKEVGFRFEKGGQMSEPVMSNTVYEKIYAGGTEVDAKTAFGEPSAFFMAKEITNMPHSDFATDFTVYPTWTTLDGTTVTGVSSEANVAEKAIVENADNGYTFETANEYAKAHKASSGDASTIEHAQYDATTSERGVKGLKLTKSGSQNTSRFMLDLGKTYPTGTQVSFDYYYDAPSVTGDKSVLVTLFKSTEAANQGSKCNDGNIWANKYNAWATVTFKLTADAQYIQVYHEYQKGSQTFGTEGTVHATYIDNIKVTPATYKTTIDLENVVDAGLFALDVQPVDSIRRVHYADTTLGQTGTVDKAKYGDYVMLGTDAGTSGIYKRIFIETGTLAIGTTITFDYYVEADTTVIGNNNFARGVVADDSHNKGYAAAGFNKWNTITYTTTKENSAIGLFLEYKWGTQENVPKNVYIDNVVITPPAN